jgi:hypothetical protein
MDFQKAAGYFWCPRELSFFYVIEADAIILWSDGQV